MLDLVLRMAFEIEQLKVSYLFYLHCLRTYHDLWCMGMLLALQNLD